MTVTATAVRLEDSMDARTKIETVDITPAMAGEFLQQNTDNRALNKGRVIALSGAMQRGEWEFTGDAIRFSQSGVLLDGQHRLAAVIKSGVTIRSLVISGLPDRVFDVIDRGAARTAGDVFSIRGETSYNALAAATRLLFLWQTTGNPMLSTRESNPSVRQIEQCLDENPDLRWAVKRVIGSKWIRTYLAPGPGSFCVYVFSQSLLHEHLGRFLYTLEEGVATHAGDAAIALNRALTDDRAAKRRMGAGHKIATVFKAFRRYAAGDVVRNLRVRTEGPAREKNLFALPMKRGVKGPPREDD